MTTFLLLVAAATAVGLAILLARLLHERLVHPGLPGGARLDRWPSVSIIIPARNEATHLEAALRSVLALDYPGKEVIVVNDRSTDATGAILGRMQERFPALQVVTLDTLPPGWLGKNHALDRGAALATGELLLFTDADILMSPTILRRSVAFFTAGNLDHLALGPTLKTRGALLNAVIGVFMLLFTIYARPWEARRPGCKGHIGIGAFNLVRTAAYRAVGGHRLIALRPDDDMQLGRLLKSAGWRQDYVFGDDAVSVEWYGSLGEMMRGLEKNAFAGLDYRLSLLTAASGALLAGLFWPFVALLTTSGPLLWFNALNVTLLGGCFYLTAGAAGLGFRHFAGFPFGVLIFLYICWRAALRILARGGMEWRDTFYSLAELKASRSDPPRQHSRRSGPE